MPAGSQGSGVILTAYTGTFVQNGYHAGVALGADSAAKTLPQLLLHFGDALSLDVIAQVRVLLPLVIADRVRDWKRQLCDNQQGHHIAGKINSLPAGPRCKQHTVAGFFKLLDRAVLPASCLEHREGQTPAQCIIDMAHLAVGCEQHQRVAMAGRRQ